MPSARRHAQRKGKKPPAPREPERVRPHRWVERKANMANLASPELIHFLACPDCGGDLLEAAAVLKCAYCHREYEVINGIPLLYPENMDIERLREEENLAEMMKQPRLSRRDRFISVQWEKSKQEFWGMVKDNIEAPLRSFINVGCGYDASFNSFQQEGYVFVNFDIVYDMLYTLQRDYGARYCVAGDINSLPFKEESFDYVVCIDVVHHESDKLSILLKSFGNLLKPGGSLFLEDLNAWGMFQLVKSLLLPKPLHRFLRATYHKLKRSTHKPADYEFPTSPWRVKRIMEGLGFCHITVHPNRAYPNIGPLSFRGYKVLSETEWGRKHHNYHYVVSAVKK